MVSGSSYASKFDFYYGICLILQTTLEVFMELEHRDQISETNLGLLESIIESVCPMLMENIQRFKAQHCKLHKCYFKQHKTYK